MAVFGGILQNYQLLALLFFLGVSHGVAYVFMTIPVSLCPLEIGGLAIAGMNIFNFIGGGFFQYFMGFMIDSTHQAGNPFFSYQIIFIICALGAFLALAAATFFNERPRIENDEARLLPNK